MNFTDLIAVLPKIMPLLPQLAKGVEIVEKVAADPDAKSALTALEELVAVLKAQGVVQ